MWDRGTSGSRGTTTVKGRVDGLVGRIEELYRSGWHQRRNRMLVEKLRLGVAAQKYAKMVEPSNDALQLHRVNEKDRHRDLVLTDVIQKHVLYILAFFACHFFVSVCRRASGRVGFRTRDIRGRPLFSPDV